MSSLKDNKAISILNAAAEGNYAIPAVCVVSFKLSENS
jgi:hypothetical protein